MTKLTTERLSKLRDNLLQFQDSYSDPADKENYDIFVDALHVIDEFKIAKEKILAYEQAAKNPAEYKVVSRFGDISLRNQKCEAEMYRSMKGFSVTPLYAAPILPKQPDGTLTDEGTIPAQPAMPEQKIVGWIFEDELPKNYPYDAMFAHSKVDVVRMFPVYAPSAAQPVIPEGLIKAINRLLDNDGSRGKFSAMQSYDARENLERLLAAAQPVSEPYKLEIDMDDADHFSITHLHEIIYGKELIWPEAKLLARFMLDVKQRASASPAQDDKSASAELPNHSNLSTNSPVIPDGWKLVPIEPTPKMRVSGKHAMKGCESIFEGVIAEVVYGAMVNAAPAQEQK